jgi:hypothetical protein
VNGKPTRFEITPRCARRAARSSRRWSNAIHS